MCRCTTFWTWAIFFWLCFMMVKPKLIADREHLFTLPKTNIAPKMVVSNRNLLFQGAIFKGYVSFREGNSFRIVPVEWLTFCWERDGILPVMKKWWHPRLVLVTFFVENCLAFFETNPMALLVGHSCLIGLAKRDENFTPESHPMLGEVRLVYRNLGI